MNVERLEERCVPASMLVGNDLLVVGTDFADGIVVNASNASETTVTLNGADDGTFDVSNGRIIVMALGGNDVVQIKGNLTSEIYAGLGNDRVTGGYGSDFIFGEDGNDTLVGGSGNDVLIGGDGRDMLSASSGDNILIGDESGRSFVDLQTDLANWESTGNPAVLAALFATVSDDGQTDYLIGSSGADAFLDAGGNDRIVGFGIGDALIT